MHSIAQKMSVITDKTKKASLERIKNQLEQARLNLRLSSESGDNCEIRYWSKQVRLIQAILGKVQGISPKKSETP